MNNEEIKEIYLSNLEWTKTHDNMGGVMANVVFKDNIPYEEYEKMLKSGYFILCNKDYITNLQEELKKKDAYIKYLNERTTIQGKVFYGDAREVLQERIDKAIEYMEHEEFKKKILLGLSEKKYIKGIFDRLLNILQGSDNNE